MFDEYVVIVILGYLLGSIPVSLLVARHHGVDLRRTADGNPGAWNALQQLGPRSAWPAFAGDGLKGAAAALTGLALSGPGGAYAGVAAAMAGHAFPAFAHLRGGKAVMTFVGGMAVLAPVPSALALALCVMVSIAVRSFARGARAGVVAVVPLQLLLDGAPRTAATGVLMCLIGALFLVRRSDGPARSAPGAAPPA